MTNSVYEKSSYLILRLLREYLRPHWRKLAVAIICMLLVAASTAMHAWLMQPVLDDIFLKKNSTMLLVVPLAVLAITLVKGFASYGQSVIIKILGQRMVTDLQADLYRHVLRADVAQTEEESAGRLLSRFLNDIQLLRVTTAQLLTALARESITLVFLVGVMFYQSFHLALVAFLAFPLGVYPMILLGKRMRRLSRARQEALGDFTTQLHETLTGGRLIRAYHQEEAEIKKATEKMERVHNLYAKAARTESLSSPIMESLSGIAIAAVIWYGGSQVLAGETTPGAFFSFITALLMAYKPMKSLSGLNTLLQEGLAAARRLFLLIDTPPTIVDSAQAKPLVIAKAEVTYRNVAFAYSNGTMALKNISLDLLPGKTVALVGPSGGGKSTAMQLLPRFYDVTDGQIEIDGQNIRDVTLASLRSSIAMVSQDVILFEGTVAENISYGLPNATRAEIIEAAKAAAADGFITALPDGYDTWLGAGETALSGGQRQRLAIARALIKNAAILLLDEATSALDPVAEQHVQAALRRLTTGRTTLVIAHRLSTVLNADCIYVIVDGEVKERGTHSELVEQNGVYTTLYKELMKS